jgi:hypothetical protein
MFVFTDVDPSSQQVDVHVLTDPPAMKLPGPPNLRRILSQELKF